MSGGAQREAERLPGERREPLRVLLVVAPFGLIEYPHLGTSLLKAEVRRAGFDCDLYYASVEFAKRIGYNVYRTCYYIDPQLLISERIFAPVLFGDQIPPWRDFWQNVVLPYDRSMWTRLSSGVGQELHAQTLERLQEDAAAYVEEFTSRRRLASYGVIGFSTSYGQNLASLSMARRIRELHPGATLIFGGANCTGPMGQQFLRSFPFIDYVCSGDADVCFPEFLRQLQEDRGIHVPGIFGQTTPAAVPESTPPFPNNLNELSQGCVGDLDGLPYPDFSDYFEAFAFGPDDHAEITAIPMEASRGCWWGEKHHCTFCGLNGESMKHRAKSPERINDELRYLVDRHGVKQIMMTDNIMSRSFVADVVPLLSKDPLHERIFFELKANLKKRELQALANAGITHLQPGMESLSTRVLRLMSKGVNSFQNLQLLKWAKELGIRVAWNMLCGLPGEAKEDYDAIAELIPTIYHLQPPLGFAQITIDRFSPLFAEPARFGLEIKPNRSYFYVYALPEYAIENLAYWFSHTSESLDTSVTLAVPEYAERARRAYLVWRRVNSRVELSYEYCSPDCITVHDTRPAAPQEDRALDRVETYVFEALDRARSVPGLMKKLRNHMGATAPAEREVRAVLDRFRHWQYVYTESGRFLVLANLKSGARQGLTASTAERDDKGQSVASVTRTLG